MADFTQEQSEARSAMQEQMVRSRNKDSASKAMDGEKKRRQSEIDMEISRSEMIRTMNAAKADAAALDALKEQVEKNASGLTPEDLVILEARVKAQEEMVRANSKKLANLQMDEERKRRQNEQDMENAKSQMMRAMNARKADAAAAEGLKERIEDGKKELDMGAVDARAAAQEELTRKVNSKIAQNLVASEAAANCAPIVVDDASKAARVSALSGLAVAADGAQKRRTSILTMPTNE